MKNDILTKPFPNITDSTSRWAGLRCRAAGLTGRSVLPRFMASFHDYAIAHRDRELALPFWTVPAKRQRRRRFELARDAWTTPAASKIGAALRFPPQSKTRRQFGRLMESGSGAILRAIAVCSFALCLCHPACHAQNSNSIPAALAQDTNSVAITAAVIQQKTADLLCGMQKGICYSGFRRGQHPDRGEGAVNPADPEILQDLEILGRNGNFSLIRLYDSGANSEAVLRLIAAHNMGMKVVLGAWLDAEVSNPNCPWQKQPMPQPLLDGNKAKNAREIENTIRLANQYSNIVIAVAVGNEALVSWNDHMVPVESVIHYVRHVKKSISQPVTVAENYAWWAQNGATLAGELDFISVHTYPIWEGKDIDQAMAFTVANLQAVRNALPRSRIVITEAGWATVAREFGARAGEQKQQRYYRDLYDWAERMNITTFFFEAFDEDWKGEPNDPLGAEKHWGLFTVDRKAKLVMADLYPDQPKR